MRTTTLAAYASFAAFGVIWGVWGAAVPQVQDRAGVSDGQLGLALLCIGAGALPAMLLAGRLIDRLGLAVVGGGVAALGLSAAGLVEFATDLARLCVGLAVLGALSGSADVGINAIAGRAETMTGQRVIARSHGIFSAAVLVSSLASGGAFALGASVAAPFLAAATVSLLAGGMTAAQAHPLGVPIRPGRPIAAAQPPGLPGRPVAVERATSLHGLPGLPRRETVSLVLLGLLGALAFATENAHQSERAVFAHNQLQAGTGLAAVAPAVFAAGVSASRLTLSVGRAWPEGTVLLWGAGFAAAGTAVVAVAPDLAVDGVGLILAAAGTAVLFPTLLSIVSRTLPGVTPGPGDIRGQRRLLPGFPARAGLRRWVGQHRRLARGDAGGRCPASRSRHLRAAGPHDQVGGPESPRRPVRPEVKLSYLVGRLGLERIRRSEEAALTVNELFRLDDKVAIVTGASSGLGVAIAQALAEAGADVVLGARRVDRLADTAQLVTTAGRQALVVATDVGDPASCGALVDAAIERFGRVDLLVNNAGVGTAVPATRETPDEFRRVIDINLNGSYWMAQACGRVMQPGSSIVNIASILGITTAGLPQAAYTSSKAGLIGLTRDLAAQWAGRKGIRVNGIAPGFFETEMTEQYPAGYLDTQGGRIPLGRKGDPRELAATVVFLASAAAGYIVGQTLVVDGGRTIT